MKDLPSGSQIELSMVTNVFTVQCLTQDFWLPRASPSYLTDCLSVELCSTKARAVIQNSVWFLPTYLRTSCSQAWGGKWSTGLWLPRLDMCTSSESQLDQQMGRETAHRSKPARS